MQKNLSRFLQRARSKQRIERKDLLRRVLFESLEPRLVMTSAWQNVNMPTDVNDSGETSPLDALLVINELNSNSVIVDGTPKDRPDDSDMPWLDVSGDGYITPLDVLLVVNELNSPSNVSDTLDSDADLEVLTAGANFSHGTGSPGNSGSAIPTAPATKEIRVNNHTTNNQLDPSIGQDASGRYVIAWTSQHQDGSDNGIYFRRFSEGGVPSGNESRANVQTSRSQEQSSIDVHSDGRFVIVWQSDRQDGNKWGVYARHFAANGTSLTGELLVNKTTSGDQKNASVTYLANGNFVVAWDGNGTSDSSGVYFRIFNAQGVAQTGEILANATASGNQQRPSIDASSHGFTIAWFGAGVGDSEGVFARNYNNSGVATSSEYRLNHATQKTQDYVDITVQADGKLFAAWQSNDSNGLGVYARYFSSAGLPLTGEWLVNQTTHGNQYSPDTYVVASTLMVSWDGKGDKSKNDANDVFVRSFDTSGKAMTGEQLVNSTTGDQQNPVLIANSTRTVVAWDGKGSGDSRGIFSRHLPAVADDYLRVPGPAGQTVPTTITWVSRDADYNNELGIYPIDDASGRIGNLRPGDVGYAAAALNSAGRIIAFPRGQTAGAVKIVNLPAGQLYGVYLIQNATTTDFLKHNPKNELHRKPIAFFGHTSGNSDSYDHVFRTANGDFAWEDETGGGDQDFNDAVIRFEFGNTPPTLEPIADQRIAEQSNLSFRAVGADWENDALTYSLGSGAPVGAAIDPVSGVFSWQPTEAQGPGDYQITIIVAQANNAALRASRTFMVSVTEVNLAPIISSVEPQEINFGESLTATFTASDEDLPKNTLRFSVVGDARGAMIDPISGIFTWTPGADIGAGDFPFTIRVTDDAIPALFDETTLMVKVNGCFLDPRFTESSAIESGGSTTGRGTVIASNCTITLIEGDSFVVGFEQSFTIPLTPTAIQFTYDNLTFDTTDPNFIKDAFEVAIVDRDGNPLVAPYAAGRDALFNMTEGMQFALGQGIQVNGNTVTVGLNGIPVGTEGKLIFRLVNDDADEATSVMIREVKFVGSNLSATAPNGLRLGEKQNSTSLLRNTSQPAELASILSNSVGNINTGLFGNGRVVSSGQIGSLGSITDTSIDGNPFFYVDWESADQNSGTASGKITLGNGSVVIVSFSAINPDGSNGSLYFANTQGGTNFWIPDAPYISESVPNAPPDSDIVALIGGQNQTYKVSLSEPIKDPIMAIVSLGNASSGIDYVFDSPFEIVSQGQGWWGGGPSSLTQTGTTLRGQEGHGTIRFNGTFDSFEWTVPNPELWHGFTFGIRTSLALEPELFPPTISVSAPADALEVGSQLTLSGFARANGLLTGNEPNSITQVTVNGSAVTAIDANATFFAPVIIQPGINSFTFVAEDAANQTAQVTLQILGVDREFGGIDFSRYSDITGSFSGRYFRTSFNEQAKLLHVDLATSNDGQFVSNMPLLVGVKNISDPSVQLVGFDGFMPDGSPYYDYSDFVTGGRLQPGQSTESSTLLFHNPNRIQFDYELVFLGKLNEPPYFTSVPSVEALAGRTYTYDTDAIDPDSDPVSYSLIAAPDGMTINATTGIVTWSPEDLQVGPHRVVIRIDDGQGGIAEQGFSITTLVNPLNRPPVITSPAVTLASVDSGKKGGRLVVANDEWTLSDVGISSSPQGTEEFIKNLGFHFAPEGNGNFLAFSNNFGLNGTLLAEAWADLGHRWTVSTEISMTLESLKAYDAVFVGGYPADNQVLIDYLEDGGSIYLMAGSGNTGAFGEPLPESQAWKQFLNHVGLELATEWNGIYDVIPIFESPSPLFQSVVLFQANGQSIIDLDPSDNLGAAAARMGEEILYAVYDRAFLEPFGIYRYDVHSFDADGDALLFKLAAHPEGMWIDPDLGVIRWSPSQNQVGNHSVRVEVTDGQGGSAIQEFIVCVHPDMSNDPPSNPNTLPELFATFPEQVVPGRSISVPIRLTDADGDLVTLALANGSPGTLTELRQTGPGAETSQSEYLYQYTPTAADLGRGSLAITLVASDGSNQRSTTFTSVVLSANQNADPVITSTPRTLAYPGYTYNYAVLASDIDADPLAFTLLTAPAGMSITTQGLVSWTPSGALNVPQSVRVQVSDQRGGVAIQEYAVRLTTQVENTNPRIVSNPILHALEDELYEYHAEVLDREGDPVLWTLVQAPSGMSIDTATGIVRWRPTSDQLGLSVVHVRATDPFGGIDNQIYTIQVSCVNTPPLILSSPGTQASVGRTYFYPVLAKDLENGRLEFSLDNAPLEMTISQSGLIRWTPPVEILNSAVRVVVRVTDSAGAFVTQSYDIQIDDNGNANRAPEISSTPVLAVSLGQEYRYQLVASDPDGDLLQYQTITSPTVGNFSINGAGLISWTPSTAGDYPVSVAVSDPSGAKVTQGFVIHVRGNNAPRITSSPITSALSGNLYRYSVRVEDTDGDTIAYELVNRPNGMTIDGLGRILWNVPADYAGVSPVAVQVTVRDEFGGVDTQSFMLTVEQDTLAPVVLIQTRTNSQSFDTDISVDLNSVSTVRVSATDNVGVVQLSLTANGLPVALDAAGVARLNTSTLGELVLVATALDAAGNIGTKTSRIQVIPPGGLGQPPANDPTLPPNPGADPTDQSGPIVTITSPAIGDTVTSIVPVIGTIDDPEDNLWFWRAYVGRLDLVDVNNLTDANPNLVQIGQGTNEVLNAEILKFDPSRFDNDGYAILIAAYDVNGRGYIGATEINIEGNAKLGQFRIELTDLAIPLAGIPIQVSRVYDSRNAGREGDFGFGWNLGVQDARILEVGTAGFVGALTGVETDFIPNKTKVYLTNPSGQRVGFTYKEEFSGGAAWHLGCSIGCVYRPYFVADPGVYDTLTIDQTQVSRGGLIGPLTGGLNPDKFTLTTKDGTVYRYDQFTGLEKITDRNGQTVTFTESGIRHSSGTSIQFVRDFRDRIVQVVDPDGNKILYEYNSSGELIKVTNQVNLSSTYNYLATPKHYLDEGFDARGLRDFKVTYDTEGRFVAIIDALGNTVSQQNYDEVASRRAKILDANGNETQLLYDSRGNVLEEIDAAGNKTTRRYEDPLNPDLETTIIDRRGMVTNRAYDAKGNVRTITELGSQSAPLPFPIVTEFTYSANNDVTSIKNSAGSLTLFSYDSKGNLSSITNALGSTSSFTYDEQGRRKTFTDFNGNTTNFEYDGGCPCGSPHKSINADGTYQTFDYNQFGQVTLERTFEANGILVEQKQSFYDASGRIIREILGAGSDPLQPPTEVRKFYLGNLLDWEIIVHPNSVNADGSLKESPATPISQRLSRITDYDYDSADRLIRQTDAMGGIVNFRYDAQGNRILLQDPVGNVTTWTYDSLNRVSEERDPLYWSTLLANNPTLGALSNAQLLERIAPIARSAGDDPLYDDPSGASHTTNQGATHVRSFAYDAEGNQAKVIDRNNRRREFSYDYAGRLLQERWYSPNNGPLVETIQFAYDTLGNLTTTENAVSKYTYTYDALNRLKSVDNLDSNSDTPRVILFYEYDAQGNVIKTFDDAGVTVESTYSGRNQLQTRKWYDAIVPASDTADVADARVDFAYNASGRQKQILRYSDLSAAAKVGSTDYTYDLSGRNNVLIHKNAVDALLSSYDYNYDFSGLLVGEIRDHQDNDFDDTISYGYDLTGQLIDALFASQDDEHYVYDLNGNRRSSTVGTESRTYASGPGNQLLSDGVFTYSYDGEGNQKTKTRISDGQITENFWDHHNRLVRIEERTHGGIVLKTVEFTYDVQGRRIVEKLNGEATLRVVHDSDHTWGDYNNSGSADSRYLFGNNIDQIIVAHRPADGLVWYNTDKLGSIRGLSNSAGVIGIPVAYESYGSTTSDLLGSNWSRFGFTGREWSQFSDVWHYRSRIYSSNLGRFTSVDSIGFAAMEPNLYRYASNAPTNFRDPSGKFTIDYQGLTAGLLKVVVISTATSLVGVDFLMVAVCTVWPDYWPVINLVTQLRKLRNDLVSSAVEFIIDDFKAKKQSQIFNYSCQDFHRAARGILSAMESGRR